MKYSHHEYYNYLVSMGDFYPLHLRPSETVFMNQLKAFENDWKPYNPRTENKRYGLSLTSLDGGMGGVPDLDSLRQYNIENKTEYGEMDFQTPTKAYKAISCLTERLEPLAPHIGRSHVLRFDAGGYFPPHRDSHFMRSDNFRIIGFFGCTHHTVHLTLDNQNLTFEKGRYYFLNTKRAHSLVSFQDNAYCVVFNIRLCDETAEFMAHYTFAK